MSNKTRRNKTRLWADVPVERSADDQLGRARFATTLAKTIRSMRGNESFVFAICGPWGCGKSSVLRMIVNEIDSGRAQTKPLVVTFNPWWFSGQDQLLASFLIQFAAALGKSEGGARFKALGKKLGTLSKVLRPFAWIPGAEPLKQVGEAFAAGADAAESMGERLSADIYRLRAEIDEELRKSKRRIVIVMDDIDRLTASEISQLFVIVKAVANFPNTVYLLSFDHAVVCQAIREKLGLDGASYLEKIVQIRVDVPPPAPGMLQQMFLSGLDELISSDLVTPAARKGFGNLFHGGIKTFLRTPRSVKSITNVLRVLYPAVEGEVNWPEFVAITALQSFAPLAYDAIRENPNRFCGHVDDSRRSSGREEVQKFHQQWLATISESDREAVGEIIGRLFPKAGWSLGGMSYGTDWVSQWKAELRVCSPDCFDRYFQLQVPAGAMSETEWRAFLTTLDSPNLVDDRIKEWCKQTGQNRVNSRAKEFLDKVTVFGRHGATLDQANALLAAILRNGDLMISVEDEDRSPGIPIDNELRLVWAVRRLVECFPDQTQRERMLESLFPLAGPATAAQVVRFLGSQHGRYGSKPNESFDPRHVSAECVDRLQSIALEKFHKASSDGSLAAYPHALFIARDWQQFDDSGAAQAWVSEVCEDDEMLVRFLLGVQSSTFTSSVGDHVQTIGRSAGAGFLILWFEGIDLRGRCQKLLETDSTWFTGDMRTGIQLVVDSIDEEGKALDPFLRRRTSANPNSPSSSESGESAPEMDDSEDDS